MVLSRPLPLVLAGWLLATGIVRGGDSPWPESGDGPSAAVRLSAVAELADFPSEGPGYRIDPQVLAAGTDYRFVVYGDRNRYFVVGVPAVRKFCAELSAITRYGGTKEGEQVVTGAKEAFANVGRGLGRILTHPGVAAKDFAKNIENTGESIGRIVTDDDDPGRASDGTKRSEMGGGPAGGQRRAFALELGVDVYSDNPELRALLNEVARLRKAGGFATAVIPYHIDLASRFNPEAADKTTEEFIAANDPAELRERIGHLLRDRLGLDPKAGHLRAWLDNPNYTPRQVAYVGRALVVAGVKEGAGELVGLLARAATTQVADLFARQLESLVWTGSGVEGGFARYLPMPVGFAAADRAGRIYVVLAFDTLRTWPRTVASFQRLVAALLDSGAPGYAILSTGDIAPELAAMARKDGIVVQPLMFRSR